MLAFAAPWCAKRARKGQRPRNASSRRCPSSIGGNHRGQDAAPPPGRRRPRVDRARGWRLLLPSSDGRVRPSGEVHMRRSDVRSSLARRSFLRDSAADWSRPARRWAQASTTMAQGTSGGAWQATRHTEDDWFDKIPGKHRTFLDRSRLAASARRCTSPRTSSPRARAVMASRAARSRSSSVCVMPRRRSRSPTRFGASTAHHARGSDPKTNAAAMKNLYNSADRRDETFDALIKLGVHFAVCDKSTQGLAGEPRAARPKESRTRSTRNCSRT